MKQTKVLMGMPITVDIADARAKSIDINKVYDYFQQVDKRFSTYKKTSEISKVNAGLPSSRWSKDMQTVMRLCQQTKYETNGYFDIERDGYIDPSGLVKGWAIQNTSNMLANDGYQKFYIDAGGDIQVSSGADDRPWVIGVRNPFDRYQNVKLVAIKNGGVATSGSYIRGDHVHNPHTNMPVSNTLSLTVIGDNIYDADRYATAAYAMDENGINFIEGLAGFEGYSIDKNGIATATTGFGQYIHKP